MKNKFLIQFSLGQVIFILICLIAGGFLNFYLGARFGPEMFWGIKIDRLNQGSLFPEGLSEEELEALMNEENSQPLTFHKTLETGSFQEKQLLQKDVEKLNPPLVKKTKEKEKIEKKEEKKKVAVEEESFDDESITKAIEEELSQ